MKLYELCEADSRVLALEIKKACFFLFPLVKSGVFRSLCYTMFTNFDMRNELSPRKADFMNIVKIYEEGIFKCTFASCLSITVKFMNFVETLNFIQVH